MKEKHDQRASDIEFKRGHDQRASDIEFKRGQYVLLKPLPEFHPVVDVYL
jgi:hypothetical protein